MTIEENLRRKGTVKKGGAGASVLLGGTRYDLPVSKGTLGPDAVDVSTLYQDTGRFTYDLERIHFNPARIQLRRSSWRIRWA